MEIFAQANAFYEDIKSIALKSPRLLATQQTEDIFNLLIEKAIQKYPGEEFLKKLPRIEGGNTQMVDAQHIAGQLNQFLRGENISNGFWNILIKIWLLLRVITMRLLIVVLIASNITSGLLYGSEFKNINELLFNNQRDKEEYIISLKDTVDLTYNLYIAEKQKFAVYEAQIYSQKFEIHGEIKDRGEDYVLIWGRSIPEDKDYNKIGTLIVDEGYIQIQNPDKYGINVNYYRGSHKYIGKGYGTTGFGGPRPVYLFGKIDLIPEAIRLPRDKAYRDWVNISKLYLDRYGLLIKENLDNKEDINKVKEIFLSVMKEEPLPKELKEKWKEQIREVLYITDEEIEAGKTNKVLAAEFISKSDKALLNLDLINAVNFINAAKGFEANRSICDSIMVAISEEYVKLAKRAINKSNYIEAEAIIEQARNAGTNNPHYNSLMVVINKVKANNYIDEADIEIGCKNYINAQYLLMKASSLDPDNIRIAILNKKILSFQKSSVKAISLSLLPGVGHFYIDKNIKGLNITGIKGIYRGNTFVDLRGTQLLFLSVACWTGFVVFREQMNSSWDKYTSATNPEDAAKYHDKSVQAYNISWGCFAGAITVTIWSMVDSYICVTKYNENHFLDKNDFTGINVFPIYEDNTLNVGIQVIW